MPTKPSTAYLAVRATVRGIFWTAVAAAPMVAAGFINYLIPPLPGHF